MNIGDIKKYSEKFDKVEVMILPNVPHNDKIDIEYCYSGFMEYRLNVFLWHGNNLLGVIYENEKGEFVLNPCMKNPKHKHPEKRILRFWYWLQRNIPMWLENL